MTENTEKLNIVEPSKPLVFDPAEHYKQLLEANAKAIKSYLAAMETAPDIQNIASSVLSQLELVLKHIAETEYLAFAYEVRDLLARKEADLLGYAGFDEVEQAQEEDPFQVELEELRAEFAALQDRFANLTRK